jgi:OST-HTH/LOTUS domain
MTPVPDVVLQREVQRQLGRCLIRLQQYEHLLKRLVAHREVRGSAQDLEGRLQTLLEERRQEFARDTLGQLAETLFQSFLVGKNHERDESADEAAALASDTPHFVFRSTIQMADEQLETARADVRALVKLRNNLVHHFIEQFELWTQSGCVAAQTHLGDAIEWLRQHHPDRSPRRYGCSTWRQLLHESGQFQVRFELDASGSRGAWYQRLSA